MTPILLLASLILAACGEGADDGPKRGTAGANAAVRQVPGAPVRVGRAPVAIAVTADAVWVLDQSDGRVRRVDPATGRPQGRPVRIGSSPLALVAGEGALWALDGRRGVRRIDARTGRPSGAAVAIPDPNGIAVGAGGVWVTSRSERTVTRIDPVTLRPDRPIRVGDGPADVAVAGGSVWVAESDAGTVRRVDATTGKVFPALRVGSGQVLAVAAGEEAVWAAVSETRLNDELAVVRIDAETGKLTGDPVSVTGGVPLRLAAGSGAVWTTDVGASLPGSAARPAGLLRVDPAGGGAAERVLEIEGRPSAVAVGPDAVWVADSTRGTLTRIAIG